MEIHHIEELSEGGRTEYDNLIVLCPNCHTRVHAEAVPSKEELRNYKKKQEIAYELPVLSRLTVDECALVQEISKKNLLDQLAFSKRIHKEIAAATQDEAVEIAMREIGCLHLRESGMLAAELESVVTLAEGSLVSVAVRVRVSGKGTKWIRYLLETGRVPSP